MTDSATRRWPDVIAVAGQHAERFLQAQLTCDVTQAASGIGLPFGWCTPAGRVRASGWLLRGPMIFWLVVGSGCGNRTANALSKFILRDQVSIDAASLALSGAGSVSISNSDAAFELPGMPPRRLSMPAGEVAVTSPDAFSLAGIRAGAFELPAGMEDRFIPQMLNLDLTGGVSFTKGCYPGQEVIARTHNLGRVKRRTLRFSCTTEPPPAAAPVFAGSSEVGQTLVCAKVAEELPSGSEASPATGCELLAVVRLEQLDQGPLCLARPDGQPGGPPLTALPLPYAIPEL